MPTEKKNAQECRGSGRRSLLLILALALVIGGMIGGTVAWLADSTEAVQNVFTTSDIGVKLSESTNSFKMIPGWTIDKDPRVTVKSGSEDCWLFVRIDEACSVSVQEGSQTQTYQLGDFIAYAVDSGWTAGKGTGANGDGIPTNVYYRKVENVGTDRVFSVLGAGERKIGEATYRWSADQVLTLPTVTREMMAAITAGNGPQLTFTAYAFQLYRTNKPGGTATEAQKAAAQFTAAQAWQTIASGG